ncbi:MAG: hypothetical protein U5Q03_09950 [Bacteroidota bacterium]|nr:hypothetical protein [Bacteroidota bacterium]
MEIESKIEESSGKPLHGLWLKAAIVGGLWASIEIILGSFLHNLRIPFAGSTLTFIGIALLVLFTECGPKKASSSGPESSVP